MARHDGSSRVIPTMWQVVTRRFSAQLQPGKKLSDTNKPGWLDTPVVANHARHHVKEDTTLRSRGGCKTLPDK
jgi:hypothetical protein